MKICTSLLPEALLLNVTTATRDEVFSDLLSALAKVRNVGADQALRDLLARERKGPTLIPVGERWVAIPHASTESCRQMVIAAAVSPQGVPWDSTATRAHLVFLLIGPPQTYALYLRFLKRIARLCEEPQFVEGVLGARTPQEMITRIAASEEALGDVTAGEGMPTFAVLGAGSGGMAMAGHLALTGCKVNLYNRTAARLEGIEARGGIEVGGEVEGFATLNLATSDVARAVDNVDVVMVVVPAMAHRDIAESVAPHLKDGQILLLNPGRTGGALEVAQAIRRKNPGARPYIAEAQSLLYACRVTSPGQVHIFRIKNSVPLAALPAYQTVDVLPIIQKALPQFVPGDNVLKTSLDNIGAVFHPAITVLNAGRIEDTHGDFEYYVEGVTPAVASVLEAIDRERVSVASALGIRANTAREWLYLAYDAAGKTLFDAMRANPGYAGIKAPATMDHRYIAEDVPASLVPIASIGEMFNVPTPAMRAIIGLASAMHGVDYWAEGRTVDRLGIRGMSVKDIRFLVVGAEQALPATAHATDPGMPGRDGPEAQMLILEDPSM